MPFVQRNDVGVIIGLFANLQEGYAEEFIADDAPVVVDFIASTVPEVVDPLTKLKQFLSANPDVAAILQG